MTFIEAFCLWLASFGLTEEEQAKVCENRRLAGCLQDRDPGDTMREVSGALWSVSSPAGLAARTAAQDRGEQLGLMMYLQDYVDDRGPKDSVYTALKNRPAVSKPPVPARTAAPSSTSAGPKVRKPVDPKALLQRICREMELSRDEYKALAAALG
jgi:hypothetical protein